MLKYKVPDNLINQVQILLRKEALLDSFNPNDPSIPPSSTLEDAIAGIGTRDDHQLRCEHCKGELLRGVESIICVYCGRGKQEDSPRQAMAFKSTLGFGCLLQSLRLDGSESVGTSIGGTKSNRRQSSLKDEIALSDFLNIEFKWPDESKRFGKINEERSSTLVGVDLNDLVPEGSSDNASCAYSEEPVTSKKAGIKETAIAHGQRNLNLFEETNYSQPTLWSNEGENDEAFSGWEAEFQSAVPDAKGPFADNESNMDLVKGLVDLEKSANISSSHSHPRSDLTSEDLDVNFSFPSLSKQPEGNISVEDIPSGFSLPLDEQQKTTTADPSHVEGKVGDDSFDQWNDFSMLTGVKNNHSEPSTTTLPSVERSGPDVSDGWKDFIGSAGVGDPKVGGNDFGLLNVAQQDQQDIHADTSQIKTFSQDDSIGLWSTSMSTTVLEDQLLGSGTQSPAVTTNGADESFDLWNDFKSSTIETQVGNNIDGADNKMSEKDDRTLDVWNDFASYGASNNEEQISKEKGSGGSRNGSNDKSFASSKDNSLNAWNDLTLPMDVNASQSIGNDMSNREWNDFSSSTTVTHGDQHQSSSKKAAESQTVLVDDGSFSSWSDLRSSGMQVENSFPSTIAMKSSQDQFSMDKASGGLESVKENSPFNAWGDFGHSLLMSDKQSQAGGIEVSENKLTGDVNDFFSGWSESGKQSSNPSSDKRNNNGVMAHDGKSISENDDSFDAWGDFTTSSNVLVNQSPSSSANAPAVADAVKHYDVFDSWDVFASSSNMQAGNNTMMPKENMPEISLFSTNTNAQGVECTSSSQQGLLLRVFRDRNGTSQEASSPPKVPDLVRTDNGGGKADGHSEKINQSETTSRVVNSQLKSSDVQTLISEMHDLSFMLENSLSIPKSSE